MYLFDTGAKKAEQEKKSANSVFRVTNLAHIHLKENVFQVESRIWNKHDEGGKNEAKNMLLPWENMVEVERKQKPTALISVMDAMVGNGGGGGRNCRKLCFDV